MIKNSRAVAIVTCIRSSAVASCWSGCGWPGVLLLLRATAQMRLVVLKIFPAIEAEHLNLCDALEDIHQRINACAHAGIGQNTNVRGLNHKKHQLAVSGHEAVGRDVRDTHEPQRVESCPLPVAFLFCSISRPPFVGFLLAEEKCHGIADKVENAGVLESDR